MQDLGERLMQHWIETLIETMAEQFFFHFTGIPQMHYLLIVKEIQATSIMYFRLLKLIKC